MRQLTGKKKKLLKLLENNLDSNDDNPSKGILDIPNYIRPDGEAFDGEISIDEQKVILGSLSDIKSDLSNPVSEKNTSDLEKNELKKMQSASKTNVTKVRISKKKNIKPESLKIKKVHFNGRCIFCNNDVDKRGHRVNFIRGDTYGVGVICINCYSVKGYDGKWKNIKPKAGIFNPKIYRPNGGPKK